MNPVRAGIDIQCDERVSEPPWYLHDHQCTRRAVRRVDDRPLCTQHAKREEYYGGITSPLAEVEARTAMGPCCSSP